MIVATVAPLSSLDESTVDGDGWVARASLPAGWRITKYVRNHHYVELISPEGERVRLNAVALLRGECTRCALAFYVESRIGSLVCPHCQGGVNWVWGQARLSFVAENDSGFTTLPEVK